ncbi:MAG: helicase-associated domain-containing protein [Ktedonobacteraceae bacterium]|nr:helicase-associated domain-containing protein [Ktedonobacteraceae bacterium]
MEQIDVELLQTAPSHHVQTVLKARQMKGQSNDATQLFEPTSLQETIRGLDEVGMAILRELVACGGRANSRDLALYFYSGNLLTAEKKSSEEVGQRGLELLRSAQQFATLQYPPPHPHGAFEVALRHLLMLGLLFWGKQTNFAGRDYSNGVHDGVLIVPRAVQDAVREIVGAEEPLLTTIGEESAERVYVLQRTLYLYWSFVALLREGLTLLANGLLARAALRQITEHMDLKARNEQVRTESDVPSLLFIRLLLMKLGLLQQKEGTLCAAPAESFFSLPLLERARRCYRLWLDTSFWNELLYIPEMVVRPALPPLEAAHEEVLSARKAVMERLAHERVGEWHNIATFIARTKLYAPYLLFPRQYGSRAERYSSGSNPYGLDFRLKRGWLTHREGWHMVEGGFIRTMLIGPLYWLGVVEVDQEEAPTRFRFAHRGSLVISDRPLEKEEVSWGRLVVQPNFEVVALAPVSEELLVRLDRFAERISLEHIAQYRLTKASVTRAIQIGLHADTIQKELESAAGDEIPQNVQYSLVEWERQARRIEVWQGASLLEVDDPALLDALMADEWTRSLVGRRFTPTLAEVAPRRLLKLQEFLWQHNYLPTVVSAPAQDVITEHSQPFMREAQWHLREDGLLQPLYPVLDLYLVAKMHRFSQPAEQPGWWKITPSSLQRGLQAGLSLDSIVHFLQAYCEEGVPPSLLIRLKLWGGGYEGQQDIYVERAPLLRLSEQVLGDLRQDTELAALLSSEVELGQHLVRVSLENIERVLALLRERGFTLD